MCGRFTQLRSWADLVRLYRVTETAPPPNWPPRYNVAPTQDVAVVRPGRDGGRRLMAMRWGLVPAWAKDAAGGAKMINARAETLASKPAFRGALRRRRCLVLADGFYEWRKRPRGGKQPWRITWPEESALAFAGLFERWTPAGDAPPLLSCSIVTTEANGRVRPLHDRMPVLLDAAAQDAWLDVDGVDEAAATALLRPYAADDLIAHPVDPFVNAVANDGPRCIDSVADPTADDDGAPELPLLYGPPRG